MAVGGMEERWTFSSLSKTEKKLSVAKFNDDDSLSFIWEEKNNPLFKVAFDVTLSDLYH